MNSYTDISTLAEVVLEDSFVLRIDETPEELRFTGDFVLTERHSDYHAPAPDEQECYAKGCLVFPAMSRIDWTRRSYEVIIDAAGEEDLGTFDELTRVEDHWLIGGEWGEARVFSDAPYLVLTHANDG